MCSALMKFLADEATLRAYVSSPLCFISLKFAIMDVHVPNKFFLIMSGPHFVV